MDSPVDPAALHLALFSWYAQHGRDLAFRRCRDPWAVLVSEVMLQQTQVSRVEPVWSAFMARFPSPSALARATPADALRAWGGLGYNRRGLNLWRASVTMLEQHGGCVPRTLHELRALPGVGEYTARAVAAIAFSMPVAAVDTNVRRVVGRVAWGEAPARTAVELQALADFLVDQDAPGPWTHSLMDLGATVCRARQPACQACPAEALCRFAAKRRDPPEEGSQPAAPAAPTHPRRRTAGQPFAGTTRWLRGRIVDRLRQAPPGEWVRFDEALGVHGPASVTAALVALTAEGLLERHEDGGVRLPVSTA